MNNTDLKVGIIILAAGASFRMGSPKQLIKVGEKSLIRHIAEEALTTQNRPVVVVLGANKAAIVPEIADLHHLSFADNPQWQKGMASSIKMGLVGTYLIDKHLDAVIILVSDQPHVSAALIRRMIAVQAISEKGIVACRYGGQLGVPVLFTRKYFETLLNLEGDKGAKIVVNEYLEDTAVLNFEKGIVDLDTPEDVTNWESNN